MNKKTIFDKDGYEDAPEDIQESLLMSDEVVDDLPAPEQLIRKEPQTSVPIDSKIVHHFKKYAQEHNTEYQTAINDFLLSHIRQQ